ncbi:MAG: RecX family transcriptional regulator, partial [Caldiserica bacterium]|nr:RecX family transcriptional regulator [Caldisericota bacterium]
KLEKWGYINDEEFARSWIEGRLLHNPKGRFALRRELKQKGVQEELIEKMLRALYPVEREREEAWNLAKKKWNRESRIEEKKKKERTYRYLLSRGFPLEIVKEIVESLSSE